MKTDREKLQMMEYLVGKEFEKAVEEYGKKTKEKMIADLPKILDSGEPEEDHMIRLKKVRLMKEDFRFD